MRLHKAGSRLAGERGFTLIELLVVMLILGVLAAIAIPTFLNQSDKATDAEAKSMARNLQTAIEACATEDSGGGYGGCDRAKLHQIEPTIPDDDTVVVAPGFFGLPYLVGAYSGTDTLFWISRDNDGKVNRGCSVDKGGCVGGSW
jgi:type IV pilus assembly protein PilA